MHLSKQPIYFFDFDLVRYRARKIVIMAALLCRPFSFYHWMFRSGFHLFDIGYIAGIDTSTEWLQGYESSTADFITSFVVHSIFLRCSCHCFSVVWFTLSLRSICLSKPALYGFIHHICVHVNNEFNKKPRNISGNFGFIWQIFARKTIKYMGTPQIGKKITAKRYERWENMCVCEWEEERDSDKCQKEKKSDKRMIQKRRKTQLIKVGSMNTWQKQSNTVETIDDELDEVSYGKKTLLDKGDVTKTPTMD